MNFKSFFLIFGSLTATNSAFLQETLDLPVENNLGDYYWAKSEFFYEISWDSCLDYTIRAEMEYFKQKSWSKNVQCLNSLATLHYRHGNFDECFIYQDSAYFLSKKYLKEIDHTQLILHNNLGALEREKGNFHKSIFHLNQAISINDQLQNENYNNDKSRLFLLLSLTHSMKGDYISARKYADLSLVFSYKDEDRNDFVIASSLENCGFAHFKNKNYLISIKNFEQAILQYRQCSKHYSLDAKKGIFQCYLYIIENYLLLNKLNLANSIIEIINKDLLKEVDDLMLTINFNILISKYKNAQFKHHESIHYLEIANFLIEQSGVTQYTNKKNYIYNLIAESYLYLKQKNKALEYLNNLSINTESDKNVSLDLLTSLKLKTRLLNNKDYKLSYPIFQQMNFLLKSLRLQNSTASHKEFWANENLEIYQDAICTFIESEDIDMAFTFAEENKSNLLIQSLNDIEAKSYANIPEEFLNKERELRAQLQFYQQKKFELINSQTIDSARLVSYNDIITKTDFKIEAIVDTLESQYPEYYELKYNEENLSVSDIQSLIDKETAFIEFFVGKDSAYVFTITSDNVKVNKLEHFKENSEIYLKFYNHINNPDSNMDSLKYYSKLTYDLILKKALYNFDSKKIKNIVIIPDDVLNNLPFEMMISPNDTYLGFDYNIHYQYSGRLWRLLKNRKIQNKKFDFVGFAYNSEKVDFLAERACATMEAGNLLCSEKEINTISNILKEKNLTSIPSGMKDVLKYAAQSKIIHLATHSCLDAENSDYSRIFFNDGHITNIDLQLQTLNADLAVLSACESGYGELIKGEGAMSISKGFFHAGCKSTVVSLWPVDDCSTAEFMGHFYSNLESGLKKDVALKKAKQDYLQTAHPSRTHPYYWAGFILIGDSSPIWSSINWNPFIGGGVLILGLIGLFFLFINKKSRKS